MTKRTSKNAVITVNGKLLSTDMKSFSISETCQPVDVTGFLDGSTNYTPGLRVSEINLDAFWDAGANKINSVLQTLATPPVSVLVIPDYSQIDGPAYQLMTSYFLTAEQVNFNPSGAPGGAIEGGSIQFVRSGAGFGPNRVGIERGTGKYYSWTAGNSTTSFGDVPGRRYDVGNLGVASTGVTYAGYLSILGAAPSDTYAFSIAHSDSSGSGYTTLMSWTLDGQTLAAERVTAANATVKYYKRFVATRTAGTSADNPTVVFHWFQSN